MTYIPGAEYKFYAAGATPAVIANTTTQTSLIPAPISADMSSMRAPNWWTAKRRATLSGGGFISVPAGAQPTFYVMVNGSVIASSPLPNTGLFGAFTAQGFEFEVDILCETVGTTGSFYANGHISVNGNVLEVFNTSAATADTTIAGKPDFQIKWDAATTTRTATCYIAEAVTAS